MKIVILILEILLIGGACVFIGFNIYKIIKSIIDKRKEKKKE